MNPKHIIKFTKSKTFLLFLTTVLFSGYGMGSISQKAEETEDQVFKHSSHIISPVPLRSIPPSSEKDLINSLKGPVSPFSRPSSPLKNSEEIPKLSENFEKKNYSSSSVIRGKISAHPNYLTPAQMQTILKENPLPLENLTAEYIDKLRAHPLLKTKYISIELLNQLFEKVDLKLKAQAFVLTVIKFMYDYVPAPKHGASFVNKGFLECMIKGSLKAEGIDVQNDDVNRRSVVKVLRNVFKDNLGALDVIENLEKELKKEEIYFLENDFILNYLKKNIIFNEKLVSAEIQSSLTALEQMDNFSKIFAFSGHKNYFDGLPRKYRKRIKPFPCENCSASHVQYIENIGSQ